MQTSGGGIGGGGGRQEAIVTVERTVTSGPLVPPPLNTSALASALGIVNASGLSAGKASGVRVRADLVVVQSASSPPWVEEFASIISSLASDLGLPTGSLTAIAYAPPLAPPRPPSAPPLAPWYGISSLSVPVEVGIGIGVGVVAMCLVFLCYYCDASPMEKQSLARRRRMALRTPAESGAGSSRRGRAAATCSARSPSGCGVSAAGERTGGSTAGWWLSWRAPPSSSPDSSAMEMEMQRGTAPQPAQAPTAEPQAAPPIADFLQRI